MKHLFKFVLALLVWATCTSSAQAGEWELLRYERNSQYYNQDIAIRSGYDTNGGTLNVYPLIEKHSNRYLTRWRDDEKYYVNGKESPGAGLNNYIGVQLWWNAGRPVFNGPGTRSVPVATSSGKMNITPVFRWKRSQIREGYNSYRDNPDDNPPRELFYTENVSVVGNEGIRQWDGNSVPYSPQQPFAGKHFTFKFLSHPFGVVTQFTTQGPNGYTASHRFSPSAGDYYVTRIETGGKDQVSGPTRYFGGQIDLNTAYASENAFDRHGYASLNFGYLAAPTRFTLNVSANAFANFAPDLPRDAHLGAYAAPGVLGRGNTAAATTPFWGGSAGYETSVAPSLAQVLGASTYVWSSSSQTYHSQQHQNGLDPSLWTGQPLPEELVGTSTHKKQFDHDLGKLSEGGSARTQVKVKITGSNARQSKLTAKATIDWYRQPYTQYRAEIVTEVIDHSTGITKTLEQVMQGNQNPLETEEERYLNEYTAEYEAMKKEFVTTGATYIGLALEAEMMVGSWYVPDEVDLATGGLTLAGKPIRKLFKVFKGTRTVIDLSAKIASVRGRLAAMVPAVQKALNHGNFTIVLKRRKFRELRGGHVGPDGHRVPSEMGEIQPNEEICRVPGTSCFVAGTLVSTEHGQSTIETLKKDDLVWSRSESTGKTELKRIVQTFERFAVTLKLTFSNGDTIETTKEHPFYVAGKGFVPAGEMGIGTSIVTRAGPVVTLVAASVGRAQNVFNFEVEDFHSYFVGQSEAWVHNQCSLEQAAHDHADEVDRLWRTNHPTAAKPGTAGVIDIPGLGRFPGHSGRPTKWGRLPEDQRPDYVIDGDVTDLYNRVIPDPTKRASNHGDCAESQALSKIYQAFRAAGVTNSNQIEDAIRASGAKSSAFSIDNQAVQAPCRSCREVLKHLGIGF